MNQEKVGNFIAKCRREAGLTQAELAEKLGITNRAVSKWETGKSMPDVSLMLDLCEILHISVNELLSGEHLAMEEYKKQAEDNLMELKKKEKRKNTIINLLMYILVGILILRSAVSIYTAIYAITGLDGTGRIWIIAQLIVAVVMLVLAFNIVVIVRKKNKEI